MRILRLVTILATLLSLPGYGLAGLAQARSCQEQMSAAHQVVLAGDCCPGKADQSAPCKRLGDGPSGKNGRCSACKAGYNCKSPQPYEPNSTVTILIPVDRPTPAVESPAPLLSYSPFGLWRPPRLS